MTLLSNPKLLFFFIISIGIYVFFPSSVHAADWYDAAWGYRTPLTIDSSLVGGTSSLTNFPVLINIATSTNLKHTSNGGKVGNATGSDFLITSSSGTFKLNHEIEKYSSTTGELVAWVQVPILNSASQSTSTVLYLYYGNSAATNQQQATSTWESSFKGVWHLGETSSSSGYTDSTVNANHGTSSGTMFPSATSSSQINGGQFFDATNDEIDARSGSSLDTMSAISISAWIKPRSVGEGVEGIIVSKEGGGDSGGWGFTLSANDTLRFFVGRDATPMVVLTPPSVLTLNRWNHVAVSWNGTLGSSNVEMYVNGVMQTNTGPAEGSGNRTSDNSQNLLIGNDPTEAQTFDGTIDEVRVSNATRSAGWIKTEFNNQSTPSAFYLAGTEENYVSTLNQSQYRWYLNGDQNLPLVAMTSENGTTSLGATSTPIRLRMNASSSALTATSSIAMKLQYSTATSSGWTDVGETSSTTAWKFYNSPSLTNTATLSSTVLSGSTAGQIYQESNTATTNVKAILTNGAGEWDFSLDSSNATSNTYYFRLILSDNSTLSTYTVYPEITINQTNWYNGAWGYRTPFVIDSTKVGGTSSLFNFPVLINVATSTNFKHTSSGGYVGNATGSDLLFTFNNGTTKLNHEIEKYSSTTGELVAWVQVPTLHSASQSTSSVLYMYYGNAGVANQQQATSTWESSFKGVWHLGETSSSSGYTDSTVNVEHGTSTGTAFPTATTSGQIAGAQNFDASDDYININDIVTDFRGPFTLSGWIRPNGWGEDGGGYILSQPNSFLKVSQENNWLDFGNGDNGTRGTSAGSSISLNNWQHIAVKYDGSGTLGFYINGTDQTSDSTLTETDGGSNTVLGGSIATFGGLLDELRVSNATRSAGWILTEFNNQSTPSAFYLTGTHAASTTAATATPASLVQAHYRWRNNDGSESGATFATGTDGALPSIDKRSVKRLRVSIKNTGQTSATTSQFKIYYAPIEASCSAVATTSWVALVNTGVQQDQHWSLANVGYVAHGASTTDVATGGGIDNDSSTFTEGQFISYTNLTSVITLASSTITELEYSLWAENPATNGTTYCFRVTDETGGQSLTYTTYPQITLATNASSRSSGTTAGFGGAPPTVATVSNANATHGGASQSEGSPPSGVSNVGGGGGGGGSGGAP